jgi:hypothetical protein
MSKLGLWGNYETKVVCNELRRQDLLSHAEWVQDATDCVARFSAITYSGYLLWAIPCLRLVRKSPWFARQAATVVRWMVADIRFEKGLSSRPHQLGRIVRRNLFWPGNWLLGQCLSLTRFEGRGARSTAIAPASSRY